MPDIRLDSGFRTAIVRGKDAPQHRLALSLAAFGQGRALWDSLIGVPQSRYRYLRDQVRYPINPRSALDLSVLALGPGYLEGLERTLGRRIRLSPALKIRLERIRRKAQALLQPLKSGASRELMEQARPYQAFLESKGYELWPVQIRDAAVLAARNGGLLAFAPRLGKTRTAYAACLARGIQRTLVVADAGPLPIWNAQLQEVFGMRPEQIPMLSYAKDLGSKGVPKDRKTARAVIRRKLDQLLHKAGDGPVVLAVSFNLMASLSIERRSKYSEYPLAKELLRLFRPGAIIVDEAHHAANRATRHGHILSLLKAPMRMALTGTPTNGRTEVQTTLPAWLAGGWTRLSYPYRRHIHWPGSEPESDINALNQVFEQAGDSCLAENALLGARVKLGAEGSAKAAEHLRWHARTRSLLLERTKSDPAVLASSVQLEPEHSIEEVVFAPAHEDYYQSLIKEVSLIAEEKKRLQEVAEKAVSKAGKTDQEWERDVSIYVKRATVALRLRFNSAFHRLSIASSCPWDPRLTLPDGRRYLGVSSKYQKVLQLAEEAVKAGEKFIVLTHHRAYSEQLIKDLAHLGVLDCTRGLTGPEKKALQDRFWSDASCLGLVLNGAAAGEAYDFAAANVMIVADLDERLTKLTQAMHRICGPRQTRPPRITHVMHKLAHPNGLQVTVDEDVFKRLTIRKGHADLALNARGMASLDDWEARANRLTG